jgi:excinuclease ABC subunit C
VHIPEPIRLRPASDESDTLLAGLKQVCGAYLLYSAGTPLHLSWSSHLGKRLRRLLASNLREKLELVECWPTGSKLELQLVLYAVAKRVYPERYGKILRLRKPWFVHLMAAGGYPRLETTNRVSGRGAALWGPFASRGAAQQYEEDVLGLFQMRRCAEKIEPNAAHPGCIYGEMNQCLRPCQSAVSGDEYRAEAERVRDFLQSNGRRAIALLVSARDRACEEAEFEQAGRMHARIEGLKAAAGVRDPVVAELEEFNGVALTRSLEEGGYTLWPVFGGLWQEPVRLFVPRDAASSKSLDAQVRELLAERVAEPRRDGDRGQELAIFARWFYSSWRDGEWFGFANLSGLNYRKLVREISKLAKTA